MKFSKEILIEIPWRDIEGFEVVYNKITGKRRWVDEHECVFKHDDKFYMTCYDAPSTEVQDDMRPYEYEDDPVECEEVFPFEKTVIDYRPKQ